MKILFLNPQIDAEHNLVHTLQSQGVAVLVALDTNEAWQMLQLHGKSVDLAIIKRELSTRPGSDEGTQLLARLKGDATQSDLPVILISEQWGDDDFASHQKSPLGANAYLREPFEPAQLLDLISGVTGKTFAGQSSAPATFEAPPEGDGLGLVLEDSNSIYSEKPSSDLGGISLEAPPVELAPSSLSISGLAPEPPSVASVEPVFDLDAPISEPVAEEEPKLVMESEPVAAEAQELVFTPPPPPEEPSLSTDAEVAQEMPYLFEGSSKKPEPLSDTRAMSFAHPVGDAIIPGGAAQSPDIETLKKYLLLREQDVAVLSTQVKSARTQLTEMEQHLRDERARNVDLGNKLADQVKLNGDFETEKQLLVEGMQKEIDELRFQAKVKVDKARVLESQVRAATEEMERLKERVRSDIRKIRVREKELENRLEIVKKDSEALIGARENKIIELKRKLDLLEFNMDLLQDQLNREKDNSAKLKEKLARAAQVVRVAGGVLDFEKTPAEAASDRNAEEAS